MTLDLSPEQYNSVYQRAEQLNRELDVGYWKFTEIVFE
jgi:hypothetical protein